MTSFRRNSIKDFLIVSFFSSLFCLCFASNNVQARTWFQFRNKAREHLLNERKKVQNNKKRRSCYTLHGYKTSFNLDLYIRVNHSTIWNKNTKLNGSFCSLSLAVWGALYFALSFFCCSNNDADENCLLFYLFNILLRALIYQHCLLQLSTNAKTSDLVWSTVIVKISLFICVCFLCLIWKIRNVNTIRMAHFYGVHRVFGSLLLSMQIAM